MLHRLLTAAIVLGWITAMGWLVHHDVLPAWTARDVPKYAIGDWLTAELQQSQARIEDRHGRRIGTAWTEYTRAGPRLSRRDVLALDDFAMLPSIRIDVTVDFAPEGDLDEMHLKIFGAGERVELKGENYSGSMAFELFVGSNSQLFKVDAAAMGMVGDSIRPFTTLPEIAVGQSWRMNAINPVAAITGIGPKLIPMLAKVTRREMLSHRGSAVECFVVETERARAWVDARGLVLRQEVDLPVGGTISIVDEPFDADARKEAEERTLPSGAP